jgi:hypothetical protein
LSKSTSLISGLSD